MRTSYKKEDVILLLKEITGLIEPQPAAEREKRIQSGTHYCEMLPIEYVPTPEYMEVYKKALADYSQSTAMAVGRLADRIIKEKGKDTVLVSLARAGTPIGILIRRYIRFKYGIDMDHYSISIIRGRGIDHNAMKFLLKKYRPQQLLFVDGWIGKGAILEELKKDVSVYKGVSAELAVAADPANLTKLCGTHKDILIPSSCLNSTVSGLISRTVFRSDLIGEKDFHGAVYYEELEEADLSYEFIASIERYFVKENEEEEEEGDGEGTGIQEVEKLAEEFGIEDINLIKPGIGETTRVLLRRVPWKVLMDADHKGDQGLSHIIRLAREKGVPIIEYPLKRYKCCGLIKKMADT